MPQLKYWDGSSWVNVVVGAQGLTGNTGTTGTTGTTGPQGTLGIQGIPGNIGPTGTQGLQSTVRGTQGIQGTSLNSLTTKGDLYTYSTTNTRLAVGADGQRLLADSSTTEGLRWAENWTVGRNKILNGDFSINQRNFSSTSTGATFGFDRWWIALSGTTTYSTQSFTLGTAPVTGYESARFARVVTSSHTLASNYAILVQRIENVRTLANQTFTISFWAKAASGTPKIAVEFEQSFGTGGSPSATVLTYVGQATLSTSWARYSITGTLPSIAGATLGTTANSSYLQLNLWVSGGSNFNSRTGSMGLQNNTFDIWGVQLEAGSEATPFTTATGTIQGELAACQRYYFSFGPTQNKFGPGTFMASAAPQLSEVFVRFPVTMRAAPTALEQSGTASHYAILATGIGNACSAVPAFLSATRDGAAMTFTQSGAWTAGDALTAFFNNSAAYLGWSAEF